MNFRLPASLLRCVSVALFALAALGCASMQPQQFANSAPRFDLIAYFTGPTRSWGVIENRARDPKSRFRTAITERRVGASLQLTQDFTFEDGHTQQRIWHLRQVDEHRYDATASDVVGIATGYAWGNTFHWEYTLQLKAGNPLSRVHMKHWMYLAADGDLMINRVVISKFGVALAQTTEYFRRGAGDVASIGERP
jgi:hypothetical protein